MDFCPYDIGLNICCSPGYLIFRMDSVLSQLLAVAKIWHLEVGQFFRRLNYRKFGAKSENFHLKIYFLLRKRSIVARNWSGARSQACFSFECGNFHDFQFLLIFRPTELEKMTKIEKMANFPALWV